MRLHPMQNQSNQSRRSTYAEHKEALSSNERIGVWVTEHVGSMVCAYIFAAIGTGSLIGVFTGNALLALGFGAFSSYFLQLVLLPVIMVGQNVQNKHTELQSKRDLEIDLETERKIEKIISMLESKDGYAKTETSF